MTNAQYGSSGRWEGDNRPRVNVTWDEALAHCRSRSARLPTEAEWEYAARGPDNLIYPWGNEFVAENVAFSGNPKIQPEDVSSHPEGKSWVGADNLSGNVWEWVNTIYDQVYPYRYATDDGREELNTTNVARGLRGGAYDSFESLAHLRPYYRNNRGDASDFGNNVGFRCARDW